MPRRATLPLVFLSLSIAACGTLATFEGASYTLPLTDVRRPADVADRWGAQRITAADGAGHVFEDGLLRVEVVPGAGSFGLTVENRTAHDLAILWDGAAYVGLDGASSRVGPAGTRPGTVQRDAAPTIIPANARSVVTAVPVDHALSSRLGNYVRDFPCVQEPYAALEGREARLVLPIRVENVVNAYTFVFNIRDVVPPPRERAIRGKEERCE